MQCDRTFYYPENTVVAFRDPSSGDARRGMIIVTVMNGYVIAAPPGSSACRGGGQTIFFSLFTTR